MPGDILYSDESERRRLLDLVSHLRTAYTRAVAVLCVPLAFGIHVYGWAPAVPLFAAIAIYAAVMLRLGRWRHPEIALVVTCAWAELMMLVAIAVADGAKEYLFTLPVFPMFALATIFGRRVAVTGAIVTGLGVIAVGLLTYGDQVAAMPPMLIIPFVLLITTMLASMATRDAEHVNRGTVVIDPLTGLLNRAALQSRAAELRLQTASGSGRVGLVIADIDHFKSINDHYGHAAGDGVLAEAAARMSASLGQDGALYRFGGEEFVVLVPAAGIADVVRIAERLRASVRDTRLDGAPITASFGVAFSAAGAPFDYHQLFAQADRALYEAKHSGRDRVSAPRDSRPELGASEDDRPARHAPSPAPADARGSAHGPHDASGTRSGGGSWLVSNAVERAHLIDLLERTRVDSTINAGLAFLALVVSGYWVGWWMLAPVVASGLAWDRVMAWAPTARRPEFAAIGGLLFIIVTTGMAVAISEQLWALPMIAMTLLGACAGFPRRGSLLLGATAVAVAIATALAISPSTVAENPVALLWPVSLTITAAVLGQAMGRSAREHRVAAVTDALTGTLTRSALESRIPELSQNAGEVARPLALLVADLDHFKVVNDEHGHEAGDAVLSAVAACLRSALRPLDSIYRLGGEEFLIVLTDTTEAAAIAIAERARTAVEASEIDGITMTVSIGVATAQQGEAFDYDETFALADTHLYAAKHDGRNRVHAGDDLPLTTV